MVKIQAQWIELLIGVFLILSIFQFIGKLRKPKSQKESPSEIQSGDGLIQPPGIREKSPTEKGVSLGSFLVIGIFVAFSNLDQVFFRFIFYLIRNSQVVSVNVFLKEEVL